MGKRSTLRYVFSRNCWRRRTPTEDEVLGLVLFLFIAADVLALIFVVKFVIWLTQ